MSGKPAKIWFYKPELHWFGWKTLLPFGLGGDEWCRRTVWLGWNFTGRAVIPFKACKDCDSCGGMVDGGAWIVDGRNVYLDDPYINEGCTPLE